MCHGNLPKFSLFEFEQAKPCLRLWRSSPEFTTISAVCEDCLFSPFPLKVVTEMIMEIVQSSYENDGIDIYPARKLYDLEYADSLVFRN